MDSSKRQINTTHVHEQTEALRKKAKEALALLEQRAASQRHVSSRLIPNLQEGVPKVLHGFHELPLPDLGGHMARFLDNRYQALHDFYQAMIDQADELDKIASDWETAEEQVGGLAQQRG